MKQTLYISDLDGTLLNSQARLSPFTVEVVNRLIAQGGLFSLATARSFTSAKPLVAALDLRLPIIIYNGTFIAAPGDGAILDERYWSPEDLLLAREYIARNNLLPLVFSFIDGRESVSWLQGRENGALQRYLRDRPTDPRQRPVDDVDRLYDGNIFHINILGEYGELARHEEFFRSLHSYTVYGQFEIYNPQDYWVELYRHDVSKAAALGRLRARLGVDRVVCFGDHVNDVPMFLAADAAYAVENAQDTLKQQATAVIGDNDGDGVARWLFENAVTSEF